jgi:hypothetical protein
MRVQAYFAKAHGSLAGRARRTEVAPRWEGFR